MFDISLSVGEPGYWNDVNCGAKLPFICKRPNGVIQPITYAPTPVPVGNCPNGALKFDTRCYRFYGIVQNDRKDWEGARTKCESMGMQLATIHSQQVQCEYCLFELFSDPRQETFNAICIILYHNLLMQNQNQFLHKDKIFIPQTDC